MAVTTLLKPMKAFRPCTNPSAVQHPWAQSLGSQCRLMPTHSTCHGGPMQPLHHTAVARRKGMPKRQMPSGLGAPCCPATEGVPAPGVQYLVAADRPPNIM
jgi:hypothetical protein